MEAIERTFISNDWITLILVSCLVLLTVVKIAYANKFADFSELFLNEKYLLKTGKEIKFNDSFNVLLFIVQLLSVSLFLYLIVNALDLAPDISPFFVYLRIFVIYSLFVGVKFLVEKMMAVLFNGEKEMANYHYHKLVYRNYFSIILILINALFIYTFQPSLLSIQIIVGILVLLNSISLINTLRKHEKLIYSNLFYFILYLCALEIAPYFILYKMLSFGVNH